MKTRLLILFGIIVIISVAVGLSFLNDSRDTNNPNECWYKADNGEMLPCMIEDSIDGFATEDEYGNVKHYRMDRIHEIPCDDLIRNWHEEFREIKEYEIIVAKYESCYTIPEYSESQVIFDDFNTKDYQVQKIIDYCNINGHKPFWDTVAQNDTHQIDTRNCELKLIEKDPNPTQLGGPIIISEDPAPEPPPSPSKCKSGPAPSDEYYFDGDTCEWYLIQEPRVEAVFPYIWNAYLHKNSIDFSPQERSYANNEPGFHADEENKVCSPLIDGDGAEFYISSTFNVELLEIIETVISQTQPENCQRFWKTDIVLVEPTSELWGWLENYYDENEN